ncbi:MAG: type II toxin-antitoxin system VapC family toxin [Candidatus Bathyarchaeia archaeon]
MEAESYIDINVFIYWLGNHPAYGEKSCNWIEKIENAPPGKYVTSVLTLHEILVIIAGLTGGSLKDSTFIERLIDSIMSLKGLMIEPLRLEDLTRGVNLMREYRLDYEDSLHLATALRKNVKEIISNDKDFDKINLSRIF